MMGDELPKLPMTMKTLSEHFRIPLVEETSLRAELRRLRTVLASDPHPDFKLHQEVASLLDRVELHLRNG